LVESRDEEERIEEEKTRGKLWEMGSVYEIETMLETGLLRLQSNSAIVQYTAPAIKNCIAYRPAGESVKEGNGSSGLLRAGRETSDVCGGQKAFIAM
jgi:hypothetical protein